MINRIDHVVITVADIDKCMEFYNSLGFNIKITDGRYEFFAGDFKINVHVLGKELSPHAQNVKTGSADFCFEITEDINSFKNELLDKDIIVELGVVERLGAKGKMNSIYIRDPDGNLLEFCSYK